MHKKALAPASMKDQPWVGFLPMYCMAKTQTIMDGISTEPDIKVFRYTLPTKLPVLRLSP